jgi:hypothetical protein
MFLTTHLSQQSGMVVVHFDESRRLLGDIAPGGTVLSAEQADTLAALTGADVVITGLIHDYGRVRWQTGQRAGSCMSQQPQRWSDLPRPGIPQRSVSILPSMRPRIFRSGMAERRYLDGYSDPCVCMLTWCKPGTVVD